MGRCSDARERLLATAARLVHERGYTAVSVADICAEAGLKKGSFYHFFRSKHALVLATLDHFAARHEAQVAKVHAAVGNDVSARERLIGLLVAMQQDASPSQGCGCPLGNLVQEMAHRDDEMRTRLAGIFTMWQADVERLLRWANERGEMNVPSPERSAEAIMAYVQGSILLAKAHNDPGVFTRLAHGMIALAEAELPAVPAGPPVPDQPTVTTCNSTQGYGQIGKFLS